VNPVTLLFAMIFKFLLDARLSWRDVRLDAALTTVLFLVGKYALGFYLGSGRSTPSVNRAPSNFGNSRNWLNGPPSLGRVCS
jgi:membrane protein